MERKHGMTIGLSLMEMERSSGAVSIEPMFPFGSHLAPADAELTDLGRTQAALARELWNTELTYAALPVPHRFYTSPMSRAMATHEITFADIASSKPKTIVVEVSLSRSSSTSCYL